MRLFVGLPVPADVRARLDEALAPVRRRYPDLRWSRPDGWHVTLAFLGDVADDEAPRATEVVDDAVRVTGLSAPRLTLGSPGRFGRSTAWLAVDDDPAGVVAALGDRIQSALVAAGLPVEQREVRPHVTVARTPRRGRLDRHLLDDLPVVDAGWPAGPVTLYRSHLGPGGSRYEERSSVEW